MKELNAINENILYDKIVNILEREFGDLNFRQKNNQISNGVIAGQSVASAIYEILELDIQYVYKDMDHFIESFDEHKLSKKDMEIDRIFSINSDGGGGGRFISSFAFRVGAKLESAVRVMDSYYDEKIPLHNIISYRRDGYLYRDNLRSIIESFDINCCEVGVDLEKKEVYWSDDFQNFLFNHELKATSVATPVSTMFRLIKKNKELGCVTLNKKTEMLKLCTSLKIMENFNSKKDRIDRYVPGTNITNMYYDKMEEHLSELEDYISFGKLSDSPIFNTVEDRFDIIQNPHSVAARRTVLAKVYCEKTVDLISDITESKSKDFFLWVDRYVDKVPALINVFNSNTKKSKLIHENLSVINSGKTNVNTKLFMLNEAIYGKSPLSQLADETINSLTKCFGKHPALLCVASPLDFKDKIKLARMVRWMEKNEMRYKVGGLENYSEPTSGMRKKFVESFINTSKEEHLSKHKAYMSALKGQVVPPLFSNLLNRSELKGSCQEITNRYDLFMQGERMRNCVGGYWDNILKGDSHVFNIKSADGQESTIEFKSNKREKHIMIHQHLGVGNEPAPDDCIDIALQLEKEIYGKVDSYIQYGDYIPNNNMENLAIFLATGQRKSFDKISFLSSENLSPEKNNSHAYNLN